MNRDELLALAEHHRQAGDHYNGEPAFGVLGGKHHEGQLGAHLGCWYLIYHEGTEHRGPKLVVADCPQARLDELLASYKHDPDWAKHRLTAKARDVLAGGDGFTVAEISELLAHLLLTVEADL